METRVSRQDVTRPGARKQVRLYRSVREILPCMRAEVLLVNRRIQSAECVGPSRAGGFVLSLL